MQNMLMMRRVLSAVAIACCLSAGPAHAAGTGGGTITYYHFMANGVMLFTVTGFHNTPPVCATIHQRFAVNGTTPAGKLQIAGLLTAYALGKAIAVFGTGTCVDWGDTESVDFYYVP